MSIYKIDFKEPNDLDCTSYLQINDCGMITNRNKTAGIARVNGRSDYQLVYIESGPFEVEYDGMNHHLKHGFVLYPPNMPQKYIDFVKAELETPPTPLEEKKWGEFYSSGKPDFKCNVLYGIFGESHWN